jgi:hypothetical protein
MEISEEATALAKDLILIGPLPERAEIDALHIAIAVTNQVDYRLTWNCTHLANAAPRHQMDVDKPARGNGLMQATTRVNCVFRSCCA